MSCEPFSSNTDTIFLLSFFLINYNLPFKVLLHPLESDCAYVGFFLLVLFLKTRKIAVTDIDAAFTFCCFFFLFHDEQPSPVGTIYLIFFCVFSSHINYST